MKKQLLPWQQACLDTWKKNGFRGIAHVLTGAGKTLLAIAAMESLLLINGKKIKIKIVVPKTFLMYQWHAAIREELDISRDDIGFLSGTHKSTTDKPIMLYVVNTARGCIARHIVWEKENGNEVFLIADECHHYGSLANSDIFGYTPNLQQNTPIFTLGLSATPWCLNYNEVLVPALGPEIYRFGFIHALKADVINKFALFNIRISFCKNERLLYDELSDKISYALHKLNELNIFPAGGTGYSFFSALEKIMKSGEPKAAELAKTVLILTMQRREIVYKAKYRIDAVIELMRRVPKSSKIIIFGERIETAEEIYKRLCRMYHNEVGLYHSQVPKLLGVQTLRQFEDGDIRILVSCKTLDEGLNVASTDVGIVVSSTGSRRQRIQRLGRVLRKKTGSKSSSFYYLYIGDTTEQEELLKEILQPEFDRLVNRIDVNFNEMFGLFENYQYGEWEDAVIFEMQQKDHTPEEIVEFMQNSDRGLLTEDWLMSEVECEKMFVNVNGKKLRNYYASILLIIRAKMAAAIVKSASKSGSSVKSYE